MIQMTEQRGQVIVAIPPAVTVAAERDAIRQRVNELLREAPPGVVFDCRHLPPNSVADIGPLLHEWLVQARQQGDRVKICVVGRADQSVGDARVLVMPPRFETIDVALTYLAGQGTASPVSVADLPAEGHEPKPFAGRFAEYWSVWSRGLLRLSQMALLIGLLAVVSYGVYWLGSNLLGKRPLSRPTSSATDIAIRGRVQCRKSNLLRTDLTVVVLVWPADHSGPHLDIDMDAAGSRVNSQTPIAVVRTDVDGEFAFARETLPRSSSNRYLLLAVARNPGGHSLIKAKDAPILKRYFTAPEKMLSSSKYHLESVDLLIDEPQEVQIVIPLSTDASAGRASAQG